MKKQFQIGDRVTGNYAGKTIAGTITRVIPEIEDHYEVHWDGRVYGESRGHIERTRNLNLMTKLEKVLL